MPILKYTTDIPAGRTVAEIQAIFARAGAASVQVDYENGEPVAVAFLLNFGVRAVLFRLPSQWPGVRAILIKEQHKGMWPQQRTEAHARAVHPDGRALFEQVAANPQLLLSDHIDEENPT